MAWDLSLVLNGQGASVPVCFQLYGFRRCFGILSWFDIITVVTFLYKKIGLIIKTSLLMWQIIVSEPKFTNAE